MMLNFFVEYPVGRLTVCMYVCMYVSMFGWNQGLIDEGGDNDADFVTHVDDNSCR